MTKEATILLCADDYAQSPSICEGILLLAQKARINAISCLVNSPYWQETQGELLPFKTTIAIGLHLNFTLGEALSTLWKKQYGRHFNDLFWLIKQTHLKRLDRKIIETEIHAQLDEFAHAHGTYPDFIDGHQHAHQLPIIRDALLVVYKQRQLRSFCRSTSNGYGDFLSFTSSPKRQILSLLGGLRFKKLLKQQTILTNTSFAGMYNFAKAENYRRYFKQFLKETSAGGLIMCHPGVASNTRSDPLHASRPHELDYFLSDNFLRDVASQGFQLALPVY